MAFSIYSISIQQREITGECRAPVDHNLWASGTRAGLSIPSQIRPGIAGPRTFDAKTMRR